MKICPTHHPEGRKYMKMFDAYYCDLCDEWLETICVDPECVYCIHRPNKPSQIAEAQRIMRAKRTRCK